VCSPDFSKLLNVDENKIGVYCIVCFYATPTFQRAKLYIV